MGAIEGLMGALNEFRTSFKGFQRIPKQCRELNGAEKDDLGGFRDVPEGSGGSMKV